MRSHNPSLRSGRLATTSQKMKASGSHRDHSSTKVSPIFLANDDEVHGIREGSSWSADPEAPIHHLRASCTKCSNQGFESCTVLLGFIWILLYDSCMKIFAEYRRIDVIEQKTMREALQKTWRNTGVSINFGRFLAVLIIPYHVNSSQCPVNGPKEYGCFASDFAPGNQEGQYSTNDSSNGGEVKPLGEGKMELAHIGSIFFVCPCHGVCMGVCLWCFLFSHSVSSCPIHPRRIKRRIAPTAVRLCLGVVLAWASPTCTLLASPPRVERRWDANHQLKMVVPLLMVLMLI